MLSILALASAALNRALNVIVWHALRARSLDRARRRGLPLGSPPPRFAAMVISFDNLLKILPRFASIAPLKRLTFDHLLCPAMDGDCYATAD